MTNPHGTRAQSNRVKIYIESSCDNFFKTGWGAVVQYPDDRTEDFSSETSGETGPRSLLIGCIEVLDHLPEKTDVVIFCSIEHLTRWTIPVLGEMRGDSFKKARKKKRLNLDLVEKLSIATLRHSHVESGIVGRDHWTELQYRADALARVHGVGGTRKGRVPPKVSVSPPVTTISPTQREIHTTISTRAPAEAFPWKDEIGF